MNSPRLKYFMWLLIAITLVGINAAPFIFHQLDIWHAQGIWVQGCIAILFSCSLFLKGASNVRNIPLGIMHLWVALFTLYICFNAQVEGRYNLSTFLPYFNFLCLLIFYKIIVEYLKYDSIEKILGWMRWAILATLFMCVLQKLGLSQFFQLFDAVNANEAKYNNNIVVGFLGNGTHLSGFLASSIPLFLLEKKRENVLALILLGLVLTQTGSTVGDPSLSGFVVAGVIAIAFTFWHSKRNGWIVLGCAICCMLIAFSCMPKSFWSFNGRLDIWAFYIEKFKTFFPLTGFGLGKVNEIYELTPFPKARHLHLEYLHFAVELGLIFIVCLIACIKDFFAIETYTKTHFLLKLMVLGFLVSCLFNYPAHLWLPATWCMFAYASAYAIKEQ